MPADEFPTIDKPASSSPVQWLQPEGDFAQIPHGILEGIPKTGLPLADREVLRVLLHRAYGYRRPAFRPYVEASASEVRIRMSRSELAEAAGISVRAANAAVSKLVEFGLLEVQAKPGSHRGGALVLTPENLDYQALWVHGHGRTRRCMRVDNTLPR